jgi:hypothetical protein
MTTQPAAYPRHRFPAEIISHAVWLYHVFSLSLRDVELILAERGVIVTHESIRHWCRKFGADSLLSGCGGGGPVRAIPIQNRLDEQPVVACRHADMALTPRQQVPDPFPLIIAKGIAAHRSAPSWLTPYESIFAPRRNPLFEDTP